MYMIATGSLSICTKPAPFWYNRYTPEGPKGAAAVPGVFLMYVGG